MTDAEKGIRLMEQTRLYLLDKVPLLAEAVYAFPLCAVAGLHPGGTDGARFCYDPAAMAALAATNPTEPLHCYLHSLCHCLLHQVRQVEPGKQVAYELAVDVLAERLAAILLPCGPVRDADDLIVEETTFAALFPRLSDAMLDTKHGAQLQKQLAWCHADDHSLWQNADNRERCTAISMPEDATAELQQLVTDATPFALHTAGRKPADRCRAVPLRECGADWAKTLDNLLKKAVEAPRPDPEELNLPLYSYSMALYGNTPLLEAQEGHPDHTLTLLAAVDTSGSCWKEGIARFIAALAGLATALERRHIAVDLRLVQCDCHIREERRYRSAAALRQALKSFRAKGGGGTDFTPVLRMADALLPSHPHLQLLYFTDGVGRCPALPPRTPTTFLLWAAHNACLPDWVQTVHAEDLP